MGIRLLWLLMLFACSISLGAQMPAGPLVINNSDANLRMAPDESVRVITALPSSNRRLSIRPVGDSTELGSEPLEYGGWVNGPAQRWPAERWARSRPYLHCLFFRSWFSLYSVVFSGSTYIHLLRKGLTRLTYQVLFAKNAFQIYYIYL